MKKLYFLLITLFFIGTLVNAQEDIVYGFNTDGDLENWTGAGGDATVSSGVLNLALNGSANVKLINTTAGINTAEYIYALVKLKNNTANKFLRFSYLKPTGGRVYKNVDISANDTEFKTYIFDLTNSNWTGTMDDVSVHLKFDSSTDCDGIGSLDFDEIRIMASIPKTEQDTYYFDTADDSEGWTPVNGSVTVSGGLLTFVPTVDKYAKMEQLFHTVDADVNEYFTMVIKNESTDDDMIRIIFTGGNYDIPITMEDAEFKTYSVRVADSTDWVGIQDGVTIGFRDTENVNGVGKSSGTGNLIVESFEFSPNIILGFNDDLDSNTSLILYPNPVKNTLYINTEKNIEKLEVFDLTGKMIWNQKFSTALNTSNLEKGVYFLKVYDDLGSTTTKRFIKN